MHGHAASTARHTGQIRRHSAREIIAHNLALAFILAAASCSQPADVPVKPLPLGTNPAPPAPAATPEGPAPLTNEELTPPTLRLSDLARPQRYGIELTLIPEQPTFRGDVRIDVELIRPTRVVWLNATALTIDRARAVVGEKERDLKVLEGGHDFVGFASDTTMGPGVIQLRVRYSGLLPDHDFGGLFRQSEGDHWYIFTQFEPLDARRAFPSFDEPHFKVPFQVTLHVKKNHEAISNTPVKSVVQRHDGMKTVQFKPTPPLPSYLVAMAVGPFEIVDAGRAGRNKTPLRIITPRGKSAGAAFAAKATGPMLELLEEYFDSPYPYAKLDQIALPSFLGAMENPGLVTYHQDILLAMPGQDYLERQRGFSGTCAHELAHMWFGDLVTMKWWDDLWLNESFATWMSAKIVHKWKPEWERDIDVATWSNYAMYSDSLDTARKMRQPIKARHDIRSAFDGITYGKGAAVLRMFEAWIGEEKFRQGIRRYTTKHAHSNADARDFLSAISAVGGAEFASAFESFIDQPGVPVVRADLQCKAKQTPVLALSQSRYAPLGSTVDTKRTWKLPVCVEYAVGKQTNRACTLMTSAAAQIPLTKAKRCPDWVLANDSMSGYYRVEYTGDMVKRLLGKASKRLTVAERVGMIHNLNAMARAGNLDRGEALAWLPRLLRDRNRHIVSSTLNLAYLSENIVPPELEPNYARFVRKMYGKQARKLGWTVKTNEPENTRLLRPRLLRLVAGKGEDKKLIAQATRLTNDWLQDRNAIHPDLTRTALAVATKRGDIKLWERFYEQARKTKDSNERRKLLRGMRGFYDAEIVKKNLALTLTDEFKLSDTAGFIRAGMSLAETRPMTFAFLQKNFDALVARMPRWGARSLAFAAGSFCSIEGAAKAEAFLKPRIDQLPGGPRALAQGLERARLCVARKQRDMASVRKFLKKY